MRKQTRVGLALTMALLGGCGDGGSQAQAPSQPVTSQPVTYVAGQAVDAEDYTGPSQTVTAKRVDPAVTSTTGAKKECVRYKTTAGKRRCAEYKTTPAKTTTTDDRDWVLVLADGTEVDVDSATYERYPVGGTYP